MQRRIGRSYPVGVVISRRLGYRTRATLGRRVKLRRWLMRPIGELLTGLSLFKSGGTNPLGRPGDGAIYLGSGEAHCLRAATEEHACLIQLGDYRQPHSSLALRASDWPTIRTVKDKRSTVALVSLCAGLCYGGVRAVAWNSLFPNATS